MADQLPEPQERTAPVDPAATAADLPDAAERGGGLAAAQADATASTAHRSDRAVPAARAADRSAATDLSDSDIDLADDRSAGTGPIDPAAQQSDAATPTTPAADRSDATDVSARGLDPAVDRSVGVVTAAPADDRSAAAPNLTAPGVAPAADPSAATGPATPGIDPAGDLLRAEEAAAAPAVAPWVATVFLAGGVAVVPWTAYLAATLPRTSHSAHYRLAWVGFDLLLAWTLLRVGWIAGRGPTVDDRVEIPATAAATLLLVDAWFDTTTSADHGALVAALVLALVAELPLAGVCLWIAHHAEDVRERRLRLLPVLERLDRT